MRCLGTILVSMDVFRARNRPCAVLRDYRKVIDDVFEPRLVKYRRGEVLGILLCIGEWSINDV